MESHQKFHLVVKKVPCTKYQEPVMADSPRNRAMEVSSRNPGRGMPDATDPLMWEQVQALLEELNWSNSRPAVIDAIHPRKNSCKGLMGWFD